MASYTQPELRERLKKEIVDGDRGGKPGLWSARKAQLLAAEYEKAGGGYSGPRDATPIDGYDELTAKDLLAQLSDLSASELQAVQDYEQAHKARKTVLDRVAKALA